MVILLALTLLGILSAQEGAAATPSLTSPQDAKDHLRQVFDDAYQRGIEVSIEFTGNKIFSDQELLAQMKLLAEVKRCRALPLSGGSSSEEDECSDKYYPEELR